MDPASAHTAYDNLYDWHHDARSPFPDQLAPVPTMRPFDYEHQPGFLPDYRGASPASASPSGGSSPWSTASFPTQDVLVHPDVDLAKFNRGSRGSLGSLALPSMRPVHHVPSNARAYTPTSVARPHSLAFAHEPKEENPWNLVSWQPFNQDNSGAAAFFLRSPTPTKRQRTNQACEKCRERKAKCNGARPTCQRCQARGHICEYAKERRMRGPNKTGRRGSQADIEDPVDLSTAPDASEIGNRGADSPTSSSSRRSSSELAQDPPSGEQSKGPHPGTSRHASRARSGTDSPASQASVLPSPPPTSRDHKLSTSRAGITLPTLSNGNLSLHCPPNSRVEHYQRAPSSESALRYVQSMPQMAYRYTQDAFLPEARSTGVWNPALDAPLMTDNASSHSVIRNDELRSSPVEYPLADMQQTIQYNVRDASASSTPITPERLEYHWPSDDAPVQQGTFQFAHTDSKPSLLPTLPEYDSEANAIGPLHDWSTADDHPVIMA
ncbi:Fungal Zn(2)-Cys(6) binuclear cluster domain [Ceratobasidium sp. AG-Ba]|nr:Fungal Zn(2)-Cys(6) binuclear cluster domain [Ceratobasidium sp. AG-Ba]